MQQGGWVEGVLRGIGRSLQRSRVGCRSWSLSLTLLRVREKRGEQILTAQEGVEAAAAEHASQEGGSAWRPRKREG